MPRYCAVGRCVSSSYDRRRRFYTFPSDINRCEKWIEAIGREDLRAKGFEKLSSYYFLCDLHFRPSDWYNRRLKCNAVPVLNLGPFISTSTETQTDEPPSQDVACQATLDDIKRTMQAGPFYSAITSKKHKLKDDFIHNEIREKKEKVDSEGLGLHTELIIKEEVEEIEVKKEVIKIQGQDSQFVESETRVKIEENEEIIENEIQELQLLQTKLNVEEVHSERLKLHTELIIKEEVEEEIIESDIQELSFVKSEAGVQIEENEELIENESKELQLLQTEIKVKEENIENESHELQLVQPEACVEMNSIKTKTRVKEEITEDEYQ